MKIHFCTNPRPDDSPEAQGGASSGFFELPYTATMSTMREDEAASASASPFDHTDTDDSLPLEHLVPFSSNHPALSSSRMRSYDGREDDCISMIDEHDDADVVDDPGASSSWSSPDEIHPTSDASESDSDGVVDEEHLFFSHRVTTCHEEQSNSPPSPVHPMILWQRWAQDEDIDGTSGSRPPEFRFCDARLANTRRDANSSEYDGISSSSRELHAHSKLLYNTIMSHSEPYNVLLVSPKHSELLYNTTHTLPFDIEAGGLCSTAPMGVGTSCEMDGTILGITRDVAVPEAWCGIGGLARGSRAETSDIVLMAEAQGGL